MLKRRAGRPSGTEQTTSDVIVSATAVRKTYDTGQVRVDALQGIDLELRRGEMAAVMARAAAARPPC
ncbi:hypothetical protein ABZX12_27610 [Kribbella sp. NPDC003505]|uniref:hypothetical protein n=1 Tax=Kribbella sp. NPDC003505 TaxID=3154448 RepID=UPI0033A0FE49